VEQLLIVLLQPPLKKLLLSTSVGTNDAALQCHPKLRCIPLDVFISTLVCMNRLGRQPVYISYYAPTAAFRVSVTLRTSIEQTLSTSLEALVCTQITVEGGDNFIGLKFQKCLIRLGTAFLYAYHTSHIVCAASLAISKTCILHVLYIQFYFPLR
jgi:hypothetical protein